MAPDEDLPAPASPPAAAGPVQVTPLSKVQPLPPLPPGAQPPQLGFAFGLQVMARPDAFAALPDSTKAQILELADKQDERQFKHAQASLEAQERIHDRSLSDYAKGRREAIFLIAGIVGVLVFAGAGLSVYLIYRDQASLAFSLIEKGITAIALIFGGAGISQILSKKFGNRPNEDE